MITSKVFIVISALVALSGAWHVCQDEEFCATLRNRGTSQFTLLEESIKVDSAKGTVSAKVFNKESEYDFTYSAHHDGVFRIVIRHANAERKPIPSALLDDIPISNITMQLVNQGGHTSIYITNGNTLTAIDINTLSIRSINTLTDQAIFINKDSDLIVGEALALKVEFTNSDNAYGIPEHGERLKLKSTKNAEPYRLFNLDYGYYNVESPESLYGSVPVLYAHSETHSAGVFWHNPAQTFVDLDHTESGSIIADFITEAGTLDLFVLHGGRTLKNAVSNYVKLTGTAPLPQLFTMGYHQSRYSYLTQEDLETVAQSLTDNNFPVDVLWLDIDYTEGKKYFTWNYTAFPNPASMQKRLADQGAKLVTIIDPHIKAEKGYWVYDEMVAGGYYVSNPDGKIYEGSCWPGLSSYVDFFNPDARKWWGSLYDYSKYANTTPIVHIWNDMNEPSVFDVEEKTMDKNLLHYGNIQHKEVHNMYGYMQTKGTFEGLLARDNSSQRPFILTRSHFAGSQRYAAIWTGDNIATWEHLRVSIPICLTEALAGISFCGADVGGFIEFPTDELYQRWYQLGAWYPFFRAHSNNESNRREPYLYPKDIQARFRQAIRQRYAHLPYWYTVWYEHERNGEPIMRPLVYQYSQANVSATDTQFLIGDNIMVAPVLEQGATSLSVHFPDDTWFYHEDPNIIQQVTVITGPTTIQLDVDMDTVPVFYRGGSVIPRKDIARPATEYMRSDPGNLYCYLKDNAAVGTLYVDDGVSYNYRKKEYIYVELSFNHDTFTARYIDEDTEFDADLYIGSVFVFYGNSPPAHYNRTILSTNNMRKEFPVKYHGANMLSIDFNLHIAHKSEFTFTLV